MSIFTFFSKKPKVKKFRFTYQQFPFGEWLEFTVSALDEKAASQSAVEVFQKMFDEKKTVMSTFYLKK
ncbi:MAG: hypothetical protein NTZ13_00575 [Candidatus Parcubacteria bacterium]|nr:hypothetical protein [Candidatus Parcubacteria bacterium]